MQGLAHDSHFNPCLCKQINLCLGNLENELNFSIFGVFHPSRKAGAVLRFLADGKINPAHASELPTRCIPWQTATMLKGLIYENNDGCICECLNPGSHEKQLQLKWINVSTSCNNIGFKSIVVQREINYEYHCLPKTSKLHLKSSLVQNFGPDPKHHRSKPTKLSFVHKINFEDKSPDPEGNLRPCQIWFKHTSRQWDLMENMQRSRTDPNKVK